MSVFRLPGLFLLRTIARELRGLRHEQARTADLLARLADHWAPLPPTADPETVRTDSGVTFAEDGDLIAALEYSERTYQDTGHRPTEDEILAYLADEKTKDLQQRLIDRARDLADR